MNFLDFFFFRFFVERFKSSSDGLSGVYQCACASVVVDDQLSRPAWLVHRKGKAGVFTMAMKLSENTRYIFIELIILN